MLTELGRAASNLVVATWLFLRRYRFKTLVRLAVVIPGLISTWVVWSSLNSYFLPQTIASQWGSPNATAACAHFPLSTDCEQLTAEACVELWCDNATRLELLSHRREFATRITFYQVWRVSQEALMPPPPSRPPSMAPPGHYGPLQASNEPLQPPTKAVLPAIDRHALMTIDECELECVNYNATNSAPGSKLFVVYSLAVFIPLLVFSQLGALLLTLHVHVMDRASLMKVDASDGGGGGEKNKTTTTTKKKMMKRKEVQLIEPLIASLTRELAAWFRAIDGYSRDEPASKEEEKDVREFKRPPPRKQSPLDDEITILDALDKKYQ